MDRSPFDLLLLRQREGLGQGKRRETPSGLGWMGPTLRTSRHMLLIQLPQTEYAEALELQRTTVEKRIRGDIPDVLFLLEHPPTITIGLSGDEGDLLATPADLAKRGIALHRVDRGGQITYHGPGQTVGYPIMHLREAGLSVREYVYRLEETLIKTIGSFGARGFRIPGKIGIWTGSSDKIASIGIRIRRRVTYHGFSLNQDLSLDTAALMVSCGLPDTRLVSLSQLVTTPVQSGNLREQIANSFSHVFGVTLQESSVAEILDRESGMARDS